VTLVRSCIHEIWRCMINSRRRTLAFKTHILHTWLTCINNIFPLSIKPPRIYVLWSVLVMTWNDLDFNFCFLCPSGRRFPRLMMSSAFFLRSCFCVYSRIHSPTMMRRSKIPSPRSIVPVAMFQPMPTWAVLEGSSGVRLARTGAMIFGNSKFVVKLKQVTLRPGRV
jgi:hypothetical protein